MKKYWLFLVLILCLTASCKAKAQEVFPSDVVKAFADAKLPLLGKKITPRDFTLPLLPADSSVPQSLMRTVSLSGLKGKVVFLNFWATWCGPCRAEMPSMEALYAKYKDRNFEILAVNSGEKISDVRAFMTANRLSFPVVLDTDGTVNRAFGIQAIPTSYLIDKDGMIIMRLTGSIDWNTPQIHAALELLLE